MNIFISVPYLFAQVFKISLAKILFGPPMADFPLWCREQFVVIQSF